jgi:hypothetical protein
VHVPQRIGSIHEAIFPEEVYQTCSTPNRIHQLIFRLREELASLGLSLVVEERFGGFWLRPTDAVQYHFCFRKRCKAAGNSSDQLLTSLAEAREQLVLAALEKYLQSLEVMRDFSANDVSKAAKLSVRTAYRWLRAALKRGWIVGPIGARGRYVLRVP